jgi:hypothetical protein
LAQGVARLAARLLLLLQFLVERFDARAERLQILLSRRSLRRNCGSE